MRKLESVNSQKNALTISAMEERRVDQNGQKPPTMCNEESAGRNQEFIILVVYSITGVKRNRIYAYGKDKKHGAMRGYQQIE